MKKILFSIFVCLPFALYAQDDNAGKFKFESIPLKEDGSNKEFYSNYKQGIAFYNKAVDIINKAETGKDETVNKIQEDAITELKTALPFLEKAYSINSKNEKILTALQGSYFAMNEFEKSDRYKQELESLKK
ncbi:MAG: hypothetical protein HY841_09065 [Bacteroidetes bacterium]|nr:hypothetical protein [Bacteroidota bacterium]